MIALDRAEGSHWISQSLLWLGLILVLGLGASLWQAERVDRQMRAGLLAEAQRLVDTLNPQRLAVLSGTEADLALPEYQRLKTQLQSVRQAFPRYRFVYLMGRRPDGTVIFHVDSEPPGSEDESPPGEVYDALAPHELAVFSGRWPLVSGPSEDDWGVWVSALVPVPARAGNGGELVLGIDIDARDWRFQVVKRGAAPILIATGLLLLITLLGRWLLARRARVDATVSGRLRHLEPVFVLALGLVLSATMAWLVHGQSRDNQDRAFQLVADAAGQGIGLDLRNLRDFGLGGLVRFFEASESVSEAEFAHYTELLTRTGLSQHWAWAPRVPASERVRFEQEMRNAGLPEFRIWAMGAEDEPGEFLYPVVRQGHRLPNLDLIGFDLGSVRRGRDALAAADRSRLITALAPLDGTLAPSLRGHMLVMQPTLPGPVGSVSEGMVVTTVVFDEILASWTGNDTLALELTLLQADGSHLTLAQSIQDQGFEVGRRVVERPVLIFGQTFLVRFVPGSAFVSTHRSLAGIGTGLAGSLLSLMLALVVGLVVRGRERLEQAVRERTVALQEFRTAVEQSNDGIALTNMDGTVRFVNRAWAEMHGEDAQACVGQHLSLFHSTEHLEQEVVPLLDALLRDGSAVAEINHVDRQGRSFPTRMSASLIRGDRGEPLGMLGIARDITDEKKQRRREQFGQDFRTLVAEISADFVTAADQARFDQAIERALARLGTLFGVDRAYLFRFSTDLARMSNTHEWCASGISGHRHELQGMSTALMPWWMARMRAQRSVLIEDVAALPPEARAEQEIFQSQATRSMICVPVFDNHLRLIGFIGFDSVSATKSWSTEQIDMLQVIADLVAGALARREAAEALAQSEARYHDLAVESRSFRWAVDLDGLYTDVDPLVADVLGFSPEELIGKKYFYDLTPEADREEVRRIGLQFIRTGRKHSSYENRMLNRSGKLLWISTTLLPSRDSQGRLVGARGSDTDITARKEAELQFETLFEEMLDGFALHEIICDEQGRPVDYRYLAINPAFEQLTGLKAADVLGRTVLEILPGTEQHWIDTFGKVALQGQPIDYENYSAELGRYYDVRAFSPAPGQFACIFRDMTDQKAHADQLEYLAQHDLLTGLPNRALLADRMQQAMAQAERRGELVGVACVDLDAFKPINDRYGHEVGDRLLMALARRMREALREGDTVARLGGDEFALVLVGLQSIEACQPLLRRVLDAVAEPVDEKGQMLQVSVSLGVTFYPQSETIDADQLLRQADQAMYQAKLAGKNRYHLFDAVHDRRLRDSHQNIERVRQGLLTDEFVLFYQPKVDMRQGCVIGFEALIRWQHPDRGLLPPGAFLPMLQRNRLMIDLGDWVIDQVLRQISLWRETGIVLPVSLNVDPLQLAQPDFIERLETALARYPVVQPGDLELEVLETSALDEAVPMVDIIRAGKALGVEFALDDFGTGYSSLSYLKRLPVATLKIDSSFVLDMLHDPDDLAILQGVISLSRTFRQTVIAEGVETEAHGEMLLLLGCQLGQGYAIARPMPVEDVPVWLAQWQPPPSWSSIRALDARRLPFLVAMVEYRAWTDHLRRFLSGAEADQAGLDQPAEEFIDWLEDSADVELAAVNQCRSLHERLQAIAAELLALGRSGAAEQALARFADIETACDALLVVLQSEMQA